MLRGADGNTLTVNRWDLVVGDVVLLSTGQKVPANCMIVESADLTVDEALHWSGNESMRSVYKSRLAEDGDPLLFAGSLILRGQCKAVVC